MPLHQILPLYILLLVPNILSISIQNHSLKTIASWVSLDFDWESPSQKAHYLNKSLFIPENCALTGIKVYKNDIYVTVPRWLPGVPSTLNKVKFLDDKTAILSPFPDWASQDLSNQDGFKYIQSMEIDSQGRMWIIDVGRLNIVDKNTSSIKNGPAKITILDLNSLEIVKSLVLSDDIAPYNASFLNDIVLDEAKGFAYISDPSGAVIIYDFNNNTAKRFTSPSMMNEKDVDFTINGIDYGTNTFTTAIDGIALSFTGDELFYCALQGLSLYSISTVYLRDFSLSNDDLQKYIKKIGRKMAPSDGMTTSRTQNILYFGGLTTNAVYKWDMSSDFTSENQKIIAESEQKLQWVDTFAWNKDRLLVTSNRLDLFFSGKMDFSGKSGANFRIVELNNI